MEGALDDLEPAGRPEEEDDEEEEEDQDDFFQEFEKELMEADTEETPRAGGTPRTPSARMLLASPAKEGAAPSSPAETGEAATTPTARTPRPSASLKRKAGKQQQQQKQKQKRGPEGGDEEEDAAAMKTPRALKKGSSSGLLGGRSPAPRGTPATPMSAATPMSVAVVDFDPDDDSESARMERIAQRNRAILKKLNDRQLHQYEAYRRSKLDAGMMKKLIHAITMKHPAFNVNDKNLLIVLCGVGKIYVGELIEKARAIATATGYNGALQPSHVRTAYSEMDTKTGKIPHRQNPKRMRL